jgi:predicted RNA-binding protein Jag
MTDEITKSAPTVEEAVDAALEELGVQADGAEFEVLEQPGRSGGQATVRVWVKAGYLDAPAVQPDEQEEGEPLPAELTVRPAEELPDLTEEELDHIADTAVAAIQSILGAFGIEATIDEYEGEEGEIILDIVGGELGLLTSDAGGSDHEPPDRTSVPGRSRRRGLQGASSREARGHRAKDGGEGRTSGSGSETPPDDQL